MSSIYKKDTIVSGIKNPQTTRVAYGFGCSIMLLAERMGFEPMVGCPTQHFQSKNRRVPRSASEIIAALPGASQNAQKPYIPAFLCSSEANLLLIVHFIKFSLLIKFSNQNSNFFSFYSNLNNEKFWYRVYGNRAPLSPA